MSYAQIADADGISPSTVRNTVDRIQDKAGVGSNPEMVVWAVLSGCWTVIHRLLRTW